MKNYEAADEKLTELELKSLIPILSKDIEIVFVEKGVYLIKNNYLNRFLKTSKQVYDLVLLIDGFKKIEEIVLEYNENHEEVLNSNFVHQLLYVKFSDFGLVQHSGELRKSGKPNYLKLSTTILNEQKLNYITKYFVFLFNGKIALVTLILCFSFIAYWLKTRFNSEYNFNFKSGLLLSFLFIFISTVFHEIGHASSSRYFGAKHSGIGVGFYLLYPVFYSDVTDIWRLPKIKRVVVNLAGMYFEIIFSSILLFISFIFKQDLLAIIALFIFFKTFLNLNPLIRSDGYWILSDTIGKPNLMMHGFLAVKRIFNKKKNWKIMDYFVLIYGIISLLFIFLFLYLVVVKNPNSIIHFPSNLVTFFKQLFDQKYQLTLIEIQKIFLPILFFYFVFGILKRQIRPLTIHLIKKIKIS